MSYNEISPPHVVEHPPRSHSEMRAWFVWSFGALFYLYQVILRNSPGVMSEDLMCDFTV
jgi:hypothetical protein